ncbi:transposase [Nocardiopsis rhodophaea]
MLPPPMLPPPWSALLAIFQTCFTAPTYRLFTAVATGAICQVGKVTVAGMQRASGPGPAAPHHRFSDFFARSHWDAHQLGERLAVWITDHLVPDGQPVTVAVDDTLLERWGRKVFARMLSHDGAAQHPTALTWGNRFIVVAITLRLGWITPTPIALPVLVALHRPRSRTSGDKRTRLGRAATALESAHRRWKPHARRIQERNAKRAAAAARGHRLPGTPEQPGSRRASYERSAWQNLQAAEAEWDAALAHTRAHIHTTDTTTPGDGVIARYRDRWAIETCFANAKQHLGLGQAHNRVPAAVRRTAPLQLLCYSLVVCYYALHGRPAADTARRRATAPYYTSKAHPAFIDMAARLRRDIIAARCAPAITETCGGHPHQEEHRATKIEQLLSDIGAL